MLKVNSESNLFTPRFLTDHSTIFLIATNIILIFFALFEKWDILVIMFIYWCQSIIIGFFNFLRMLNLKDFSTEGVNNNTLPANKKTKISMSIFFLFHYGGFHFGYFVFLKSGFLFSSSSDLFMWDISIIIILLVFFINHLFSFRYNLEKDANIRPNIGHMMLFPYLRIIPMHITIVIGGAFIVKGSSQFILLLFLLLKTGADVGMHIIEHRGSISDKIKLILNKKNYTIKDSISGKINLDFSYPIKAKSLKVELTGIKIIKLNPRGESQYHIFHRYTETLDFKKEYLKDSYYFNIEIPDNLFEKTSKEFEKTKKFLEKLGSGIFNIPYSEENKFYVKAILEIPMSINASIKEEIFISQ